MNAPQHDSQLGALLSTHRMQIYAPLFIFALAVFFAVIGAHALSRTTPDIVGCAISFTVALGFLYWAGWLYSREVSIYEGGVRYVKLFRQHVWRWQDLDGIQYGMDGGRRDYPTYTLYRNGRIVLQLSVQLRGVRLAGALLTQHTRAVFVERDLQRIQHGETVTFSRKFAILQTGIRYRRTDIPWHAISEVVVRAWKLYIIETGHEQRVVDLYGMRNPHIALELITVALEAHAQPQAMFSIN